MTFGVTLGKHLMMVPSANMFCITIDYRNKNYMKVGATNINIKMHQLFCKQQILCVCVTIVQRKISGDLTRICF